ncbi:SusC/RagA family TonB-linked outer membrane protein [Butyricimonas hominis]|nr:SusC/RagA family TonB-linked outer membrane protein [Butyricimonas hominis]
MKRFLSSRKMIMLLFCAILSLSATVASAQKVTINVKNASLVSVLDEIKRQTGYRYLFVGNQAREVSGITLSMNEQPLTTVLDSCLRKTVWTYSISDKTIVLSLKAGVAADKSEQPVKKEVRGIVVDQKGEILPGVTVRLANTSVGTATNQNGKFVLLLPIKSGKLEFSFVGYKSRSFEFTEKTDSIRIVLQEEVTGLNEVQVVAYGSQKKRTVISAISSVKAEDIKELPTHSLESLLQGHMAGVEVNNMSGAPGGGGAIVAIRGYNSFFTKGGTAEESADRSYGTPLYVVDGVPMQAFTSPITGSNTLSDLDPSMIESIEVLKDAASAAIYGSRAGNGVILITTKKGRAGKAQFTANASYSASWLPKTPVQTGGNMTRRYAMQALKNTIKPYQKADQTWVIPTSYEEVYNYTKDNNYPVYDWFFGTPDKGYKAAMIQDSLNKFYNNSTDWWKYAFRTAKVLNANLQAMGGSETMRYMIGAGYYKEEGIVLGTDFERVNVITNLTAYPSKRIQLDNQLSLTYSQRSRGGGGEGQKVEGISVNVATESSLKPGNDYVSKYILDELNADIEKNQSYSLRYNLVLDYEIIRNLHLRVSGGVDYNQQNQNNFSPSTADKDFHRSVTNGTIGRNLSLINENLLSYNFTVKNDHNFDFLLGLSFQKDQTYNNKGSAQGGPNDFVHYAKGEWGEGNGLINNNKESDRETNPEWGSAFEYESSLEEERMNSYFGRLRYNYKEKYMFETTLRRDGSSVFGEDVRWATFPSVAVGWVFSDESFLKNLYWLSFGKLRVSWGRSGQKFSQRYLAHGLMGNTGGSFFGQAGMGPDMDGGLLNRKLSWEKTDQYDFGLDISLFDYRVKLTCDYYYRYTKGQLQRMDLGGDLNYQYFQWQNALGVSNEGIEMELTVDILRESAVSWRAKLNASRNWNRFEKSNDGYDFDNNIIGKSLYNIRTYKTDGFYNSMDEVPYYYQSNSRPQPLSGSRIEDIFFPGTRRLVDLNGDGRITESDKYYAASPLPLAHGGFANELRWKRFDLNIFFVYSLGRHILKLYDDRSLNVDPGEMRPMFVDVNRINAWTGPNSKNPDYPRLISYDLNDQFTGNYDCDIENVNMLRLKQLTLGYNLHERFAKKIGLSGARVFLTAENLFLLTNYSGPEPEIVNITEGVDLLSGYPLPRKFTIGLTINF